MIFKTGDFEQIVKNIPRIKALLGKQLNAL